MFSPTDHRGLLEWHLARRTDLSKLGAMMRGMTWKTSAPVAYLIEGYELAEEAGIEDAFAFADQMRANAEREGRWAGTTLELWLALFMEHRREHFGNQPIGLNIELEPPPLLDELCEALADSLGNSGA